MDKAGYRRSSFTVFVLVVEVMGCNFASTLLSYVSTTVYGCLCTFRDRYAGEPPTGTADYVLVYNSI